MNVLFIAHDSLNGGSGRCLFELVMLLKQNEEINPIILTHSKNSLSKSLIEQGIETYSFRYGFTCSWKKNILLSILKGHIYRLLFNWVAYFNIKKTIDLKKIDLIHSNSSAIDFGAYLHRKTNIPHIWHLREFHSFLKTNGILEYNLPRYIQSNSNAIICVSDAVKKNWFGNNYGKAKTIYDGVNLFNNELKKTKEDKSTKVVSIAFCGQLSEFKGQLFIIKALSLLPYNILDKICVDFYGRGTKSYTHLLNKEVKKNKLEKHIRFMGYEPKLQNKLVNYDIGLNLSKAEGFGRTTVEYMLAGLFVIGFDTGATPDILNYGKCGALIQYGDVKSLSNILIDYIKNPDMYKKVALNAQKYAQAYFCIENNYKFITKTYMKVLNETK